MRRITVQFWQLETWTAFKECGQGGEGIRLERAYDSAAICFKAFVTLSLTTSPWVLTADVFGTDVFH